MEYTLNKTRFNYTMTSAYKAISLTVRDRLIEAVNDNKMYFL